MYSSFFLIRGLLAWDMIEYLLRGRLAPPFIGGEPIFVSSSPTSNLWIIILICERPRGSLSSEVTPTSASDGKTAFSASDGSAEMIGGKEDP